MFIVVAWWEGIDFHCLLLPVLKCKGDAKRVTKP